MSTYKHPAGSPARDKRNVGKKGRKRVSRRRERFLRRQRRTR